MFPGVNGPKFSRAYLEQLLSESDFDKVFDALLAFVEENENFDIQAEEPILETTYSQDNIRNSKPAEDPIEPEP